MKTSCKLFAFFCLLHVLAGCRSWMEPTMRTEHEPEIFPDYIGVTVPCNIAPLNFMIEGADRIQAVLSSGDTEVRVVGKYGVVRIPMKKWKGLLDVAKGGEIGISVAVWSKDCPEGVSYAPFRIAVAADDIDPMIAYRLIEPGYRSWRQVGLYQRDLTTFEEEAVVTNSTENETCLNCHHFSSYSSEDMMFHARGANGGTILYNDGKQKKIDFTSIGPKKNATYPAWHPDGRYIAFSSNTTRQIFFVHGEQPIEVYDSASDLILYDIEAGKVLTDPRFLTAATLESFPSWSPDGNWLYFVAADTKPVPEQVRDIRYNLLRVSFDKESGTFGESVDTVYNAALEGGSVSHPRLSADGRYLLYTWSGYGTFPVWHPDADLRMLDMASMEHVDVSLWNDPDHSDSYHSWSSDGKWVVIGSRRLDGRYTRLFLAYFDQDGKAHKPFLLPQEDPRYNLWRLKSFNVPEFIDGKVVLPDSVTELFETE